MAGETILSVQEQLGFTEGQLLAGLELLATPCMLALTYTLHPSSWWNHVTLPPR